MSILPYLPFRQLKAKTSNFLLRTDEVSKGASRYDARIGGGGEWVMERQT